MVGLGPINMLLEAKVRKNTGQNKSDITHVLTVMLSCLFRKPSMEKKRVVEKCN